MGRFASVRQRYNYLVFQGLWKGLSLRGFAKVALSRRKQGFDSPRERQSAKINGLQYSLAALAAVISSAVSAA
jgi:hypothetical protein